MYSYRILDDESASTEQGRLEEVGAYDEVHQRDKVVAADSKCQWERHLEVVGGRVVCGPSKYARAFGWRAVFGTRISHCELNQAEAQHSQFDGDRNCWCR